MQNSHWWGTTTINFACPRKSTGKSLLTLNFHSKSKVINQITASQYNSSLTLYPIQLDLTGTQKNNEKVTIELTVNCTIWTGNNGPNVCLSPWEMLLSFNYWSFVVNLCPSKLLVIYWIWRITELHNIKFEFKIYIIWLFIITSGPFVFSKVNIFWQCISGKVTDWGVTFHLK